MLVNGGIVLGREPHSSSRSIGIRTSGPQTADPQCTAKSMLPTRAVLRNLGDIRLVQELRADPTRQNCWDSILMKTILCTHYIFPA
ncbi:hypothetical protein RRG08_015800 [Elysia crispata]|uniref:Uncharacterized protein n=1 Tax=Elysia crispata TaxID=231223 RepID=A0AAE1BC41_9GAST|nr:hypothetical protein RRG08_015800 [Elysia crispata]